MGLKGTEILLIFAVIMLLFGATRLPQLGSSLGSAIRNFKKGFSGADDEGESKKLSESGGQSIVGQDKATVRKDS